MNRKFLLPAFVCLIQSTIAAPVITATLDDNTATGTKKLPGNQITYTGVVGNSGDATATGVLVTLPDPANTDFVSLQTTPLARPDNYSAIGNVSISIPAGSGLLLNDNDADNVGPALTVTGINTTGTQGNVTFNADGSFTFNPAAGYTGTTTFIYTLSDGEGNTDSATVSITVTGTIWFINAGAGAGGDGRIATPFNTIAAYVASSPTKDSGDNIFLYSGTYTGLTLGINQRLIGQGALTSLQTITGLTPPAGSATLPSTGGTRPTIAAAGGAAVTLNSGNTVNGLNVTNSNGSGIAGSAVGTLTLADFDVTVTNGNALALTTSGSVTATGADNDLSASTGTALNVANVSIGAANLTFKSISSSGAAKGIALNTTGSSGGLKVIGSGTTDGSGGTIQNISTRGLELISTANVAINNLTFANANTTNGTSLDLDISASNAAIYMSGVTTAAFTNVDVTGTTADNGITGVNVSNFSLTNSTITQAGNAANESGIEFSNLSGTSSITNTEVSFSETNSLDIVNTNVSLNLTVSGSILRDTQTVSSGGASNGNGEGGFQFRSFSSTAGSPVSNIVLKNSSFLRLRTQGIQVIGEDDTIVNIDITGDTVDCQTDIGAGIDINGNDTAQVNFNIIGNPTIQSRGGAAVNITSFLASQVMGRVNNNTAITVNGTGGGGSGVRAIAQETSHLTILVQNNNITMGAGNNSSPIDMQARFQSARLDLTLDNNNIDSDPMALADINITAGSSAAVGSGGPETNLVYADIKNNDIIAGGAPNVLRLRVSDLDASSNPLMFLTGFVEGGAGIEDDAVATWNAIAKGNTPTVTTASIAVSLTGTATGPAGGTAQTPSNPLPAPLLAAPGGVEAVHQPGGDAPSGVDAPTTGIAQPELPGGPDRNVRPVDQRELDLVVTAALERWTASGLTGKQHDLLRGMKFEVADLPGLYLGEAGGPVIRVDGDAGGNGWFVNVIDDDGALFPNRLSSTRRQTVPEGAAAGRIDLLTVILHEMGHSLGLEDSYLEQDRERLMYGFLTTGERRLPATNEAMGAVPHAEGHSHFLGAALNIGDLPAGKSVTITYAVAINNPTTAISTSLQGTVSGGGFTTKSTNDPGTGTADDATVTLIQQPPVVTNVVRSVAEDVVMTFAAANFTGSYTDPNSDVLATVRITSLPSNGLLKNGVTTIAAVPADIAIGSITNLTYTPNANYNGSDSFGWNGSDGASFALSAAMVNLTVTEVNDAPVPTADTLPTVAEDASAFPIPGATLTGNDTTGAANESTQTLTVTAVGSPVGGTVSVNANTVQFTPAANFNGAASFQYTVSDNGTTTAVSDPKTATATASFTITDVNDPPVATDDTPSAINEDASPVTFTAATLTANDSKGPANESTQTLTVTAAGSATGGSVAINAGNVVFTPTPNYNGPAGFEYTVSDNGSTNAVADPKTDIGAVTFTITSINDNPVAGADILSHFAGQSAKIAKSALLSNDADPDGGTVAFVSAGAAANGTVTTSDTMIFYVPNAGFTGTDSFTYTINDGQGGTANGTVSVSNLADPDNTVATNQAKFETLPGGGARLTYAGIPGRTYRVQSTDSLTPPNWTNRGSFVADAQGRFQFTDDPPLPPTRFYRTVQP